jgi:zinc protease
LGYAIDSIFYHSVKYPELIQGALAKLTREDVNRAIKRYLRTDRLIIAVVGKGGEELKRMLASEEPSPMTYNSPKPETILEEDKIVEKWPLHLRPEDIRIAPVDQVFQ